MINNSARIRAAVGTQNSVIAHPNKLEKITHLGPKRNANIPPGKIKEKKQF